MILLFMRFVEILTYDSRVGEVWIILRASKLRRPSPACPLTFDGI